MWHRAGGRVEDMSHPEVDLLTSTQVATMFGVTRKTVGIWARTGALRPAWKAPGKLGGYTFARADVERTLAERAARTAKDLSRERVAR